MSITPDPRRYFDCPAPDRAMYALGDLWPCSIHLLVDLEEPLDLDRLNQAWTLLPALHPILGSTLHRPWLRPRWRPDTAEPSELLVRREDAPPIEGEPGLQERELLSEHLEIRRGPPARLAWIERPGAGPRLLLSVHHAAMDARACVHLGEELATLYARLRVEPKPTLSPDYSPRSFPAVLDQVGMSAKQRRAAFRTQRKREKTVGRSSHRDPIDTKSVRHKALHLSYRAWTFTAEDLAPADAIRRARGWTWNDVFLGLLAWSWAQAVGASAEGRDMSAWFVAVDQRPRFGITGGLGNLASLELVGLPDVEGGDALGAMSTAAREMAIRKADQPGLGSQIAGELIRRTTPPPLLRVAFRGALALLSRLGRHRRIFTNIGPVDGPLADWDGIAALHAMVVAPIPGPPMMIATGSGFRGGVSIVAGYSEEWLSDSQLGSMHDAIRLGLQHLANAEATAP